MSSKKRPDTAINQFKNSLNKLMDILSSKEPSYIRCIKPNEFKASGESIGSRAIVLNNIGSMFAFHLFLIGIFSWILAYFLLEHL